MPTFGPAGYERVTAVAQAMIQAKNHSTKWLTIRSDSDIFNYMVELQTRQLDSIFHALGDSTRRRMLHELTEGERTVGELAQPFAISLAAASKHIKALEKAGLVQREIRGRMHLV